MKIRLSTKLFIIGFAVVIIAVLIIATCRVKTNPEFFIETSTNKNNSTITIEKNEIIENEVNE
ncbi:MAG TPA: hypothetical protein DD434_02945 [Bacteroidales bacterium]|nr:hypothetical protein [Bacteroidales bacterium]